MQKYYYDQPDQLIPNKKSTNTLDCQGTHSIRKVKGRMLNYSNKNTLLLKIKVMDNFRFPILSKDYIENRLNEIKNNDKIRERLTS